MEKCFIIINPQCACASRVTVLVPYVCLLPRFLPLRAAREQNSDTRRFVAATTKAIFVKLLRSKVKVNELIFSEYEN